MSHVKLTSSQEGKAEVIANEDGDRQIPSILSYVDGEEVHGGQAKAQLVRNAQNTVVCFRDFIGKEFVPRSSRFVAAQTLILGQLQVDRPYTVPRRRSSSRTRLDHSVQD